MNTKNINIADPFVLVENGRYYMYGTRGETRWGAATGFDCYVSTDLTEWEGPFLVFGKPDGFWADKNCWAPEVHKYNGSYFMFATFKDSKKIGTTAILKSDNPLGPFIEHSIGPITPSDWECLDGTFYLSDKGVPYMVFVHEWVQITDGAVCAVKLSADLKKAVGQPFTLFHASQAADWIKPYLDEKRPGKNYVADGPFMFRTNSGRLLMLWSSFCSGGYAQAIAVSDNGEITGKWIHEPELLFEKDGGHGMLFTGLDDKIYLTLHEPNSALKERPAFYVVDDYRLL